MLSEEDVMQMECLWMPAYPAQGQSGGTVGCLPVAKALFLLVDGGVNPREGVSE